MSTAKKWRYGWSSRRSLSSVERRWPISLPTDMTHSGDEALARTFDGESTALANTVIVPTLDTPLPKGKSAIWCASFQLAWNETQDQGGPGPEPIQFVDDEPAAQRLNDAAISETDLTPERYSMRDAGLVGEGIAERIRSEMRHRFPGVRVPDLGTGNAAIAYAYLEASLKFTLPYFEGRLTFRDSRGKATTVGAFGIRPREAYSLHEALRDQVAVLFARRTNGELNEFALDLCQDSTPHQVVVARVRKGETLAETLAELSRKTDNEKRTGRRQGASLDIGDHLLVPTMRWCINHRFEEVERKPLMNAALKDLWIEPAFQMIDFKLDKGVPELASEAHDAVKEKPRYYHFDHPYLIFLKRRGAENPFFVMWVDNTELMVCD